MGQELWQIVVNPAAGGGRVREQRQEIQTDLRKAGVVFEWNESEGPMHAVELVKAMIQAGYRHLAVVGGDGSLNEVINGIFSQDEVPGTEIKLAVIPAGTGGDFARMYGIRSLEHGIRLLHEHKALIQDVGVAHWKTDQGTQHRYFGNVAGLAFDAFITDDTADMNKAGWRGLVTYLWAVLRNLWRYEQEELALVMENRNWREVTILANAGICRHNGGGMNLVPWADPQDGRFDISLVKSLSPLQVLLNIAKLYNGKLYRHDRAFHERSKWLDIQSPTGLEVDGEYLGRGTGRLEVIEAALKIAVPVAYKVAT
ncbi:MAG: diacylglycerol kinase family protein, partial [Bacteroidota bacterium]